MPCNFLHESGSEFARLKRPPTPPKSMGTPYTFPTDQVRLISIFSLDRYQYETNSLLAQLMRDQERWDTNYGTDTVADTLAEMTAYEALRTAYNAELGKQSQRSISIAGEYSVSYANGTQETYVGRLASSKQAILGLLDPEGLLERIPSRAKVRVT